MRIKCAVCNSHFSPELSIPNYELVCSVEAFFDVDSVCIPCLENGLEFLTKKASEFIHE